MMSKNRQPINQSFQLGRRKKKGGGWLNDYFDRPPRPPLGIGVEETLWGLNHGGFFSQVLKWEFPSKKIVFVNVDPEKADC
jgi:hypothetical protein